MPKRTHEEVEAESVKPKKARRVPRGWLTVMDGVTESSGAYVDILGFSALAKSTKQEAACDLLRVMVEQAIANAARSEEEQEPTILLSSEGTTKAAPAPGPANIVPGAGMRWAVQRARSLSGQARPQYRPRAGRARRCRVRTGGGCLRAGLTALQFLQVSVGDRKSIINWNDL